MNESWCPSANLTALRVRAVLYSSIRQFFQLRGALEVETPILNQAPVSDPNIDPMQTIEERFLHTSPEYAMKRLLCAGAGDIYQIAKVFRQGEAGRRHNPEFSMLEWYRVGWTYEQLMDEVAELVVLMLGQTADASEAERPPRLTLSYQQVLFEYAGIDVQQATAEEIQQKGIELAGGDLGLDRDGWLDVIMSHAVEPALPRNTLVFVHEFPASQAALARVVENESGQKVAQRFELFWNGSELANGYQELTDAEEQARRFSLDGRLVDQRLLDAMAHGLPECAGVAIGLDRILMHRLGVETISEVLAFDWNRA